MNESSTDRAGLAKHTSKQFDTDLEGVRELVLSMGGRVEQQIAKAVRALIEGDGALGEEVVRADSKINHMEIEIDEQCTRILARRAPQAGDLRLIIAIVKTITDLERIGDEAEKIARMATQLASYDRPQSTFREIGNLGKHVRAMLRDALDAFARMDSTAGFELLHADAEVDREYEAILRQGITFMMEDPRTIHHVFDTLWAVKALERSGDHCTNIGEYVVYCVEGKDVRHLDPDAMTQPAGDDTRLNR